MKGRVLIVAGSDSGGGAGIQADIKTVTALDGYAATAITALTAQNTQGVFGIHGIPTGFIAQQMTLVLEDIGADCVKTGMLHDVPVIETVCRTLTEKAQGIPVVVDPVMVAKGGAALLVADARQALREMLLPLATIVTPNLPEAEALAGMTIGSEADMEEAGRRILALGPRHVLVKGGHLDREGAVVDILVGSGGSERFAGARIETSSTHGTGCTLASAIATGIAQGMEVAAAAARARDYVVAALRTAPGYGKGHGPLNHAVTVSPFPS